MHYKTTKKNSSGLAEMIFGAQGWRRSTNQTDTGVPKAVLKAVQADLARYIALFNLICAALVLAIFWSTPQFVTALFWMGIYITGNFVALMRMVTKPYTNREPEANRTANKKKQRASSSSSKAIPASIINGLTWGLLAVLLYGEADMVGKIAITCVISGMMGGGALVLSYRPRVAFSYVLTLSACSLYVILGEDEPHFMLIAALVVCYSVVLLRTLRIHARVTAARISVLTDLQRASQANSSLLDEYKMNGTEWLWESDVHGMFVHVSLRGEQITGIDSATLETMDIVDVFQKADPQEIPEETTKFGSFEEIREAIESRKQFRNVLVKIKSSKSETCWGRVTGSPRFDDNDKFIGYCGVCLDVSEEVQREQKLTNLAHFDALTGFYNRGHFTSEIGKIVMNMRSRNESFALMIMDFNKFRKINDTLGYPAGDTVLVEVAKRIREIVREDDYVARLGADEFAIVLRGVANQKEASVHADKLIAAFDKPIDAIGWMINVNVSIGITLAPEHGWFRVDLLNNAALAHYRAKEDGKNSYYFYSADMGMQVRDRLELEMELREALIRQDQLELYYQPLIAAGTSEICSYEALIRWKHPNRGMISPGVFIPIAEDSGMIVDIGELVIYQACREASSWKNKRRVAVNISAKHFNDEHIVTYVANILKETGLEPERLELELTESVLVDNPEETLETLRQLRELGVKIALDDFGTGYSSLLYLVNFHFDKIKIDQGFVKTAEKGNDRMEIIRAVIQLARNLGMRTTAEGVETIDKYHLLSEEGCDEIQGFLISKPVPADHIEQLDREISQLGLIEPSIEAQEGSKPDDSENKENSKNGDKAKARNVA